MQAFSQLQQQAIYPCRLAAGGSHSCALTLNGKLFATGFNVCGQLGVGDELNRFQWTPVDVPERVVSVTAGQYSTALITESGRVMASGSNARDQLSLLPQDDVTQFIYADCPNAKQVTLATHTLLLDESGQVWVIGDNEEGQLGLGDRVNRRHFVALDLPFRVKWVAVNDEASALVSEVGELWLAGQIHPRQLPQIPLSNFTRVPLAERVTEVTLGDSCAIVVTESGGLCLYGYDVFGLLGTRNRIYTALTPVELEGVAIQSAAADSSHLLLLTSDGDVLCSGDNKLQQLIQGRAEFLPGLWRIDLPRPATAIASGQHHTLILLDDERVVANGSSKRGQLGQPASVRS